MPQQQLNEEQVKALQEKLKNMSPEELREFQKKQCIFCQIISGKVQARKVYEDEHVVAILDINPANPGHILITPREHYSIMPQIPDDEIGHIFMVSKALSNACLRALEVQGSNIIVANGVAAGQRAQHFMAHLIPRKENDSLGFQLPQKTLSEDELRKIQKVLVGSLGSKTKETKESISPVTLMPKEKKFVEADFKELEGKEKKAKAKNKEEGKKKEVKGEKKEFGEPKGKKEVSVRQGVNLDDIAKVLGVK